MMTTSHYNPPTPTPEAALPPPNRQATADLLLKHHRPLVDRWSRAMKDEVGSGYTARPLEELQSSCAECLDAYITLLETGDSGPLWAFIERISNVRASQQFPPSDVTEAFMLFLETAETVLGPATGLSESYVTCMRDLRACTRTAIRTFVNTYLIHLDFAHSSMGSL